jgi:hypothetical protein
VLLSGIHARRHPRRELQWGETGRKETGKRRRQKTAKTKAKKSGPEGPLV